MMPSPRFLETPRDIRAQLTALLRSAPSLDMAVAFVGSDWQEILRELPTRTRLVCWLSSTNTNPYAIEQMIDAGVKVRQLDAMHAKVYVVPGAGAIVGSANLSISALSDAPVSLQYESAVRLGPGELSPVTAWFNWLWARARSVTPGDLAAAKRAWEAARRARRHGRRGQPPPRSTALPVNWHAPAALMDLARRVRQQRAWKHIADKHRLMSSLRPDRMSKTDLANLIETVAEWTGHIGAYAPARLVPLRHVREAFAYAFDDDEDIELRLKQLASGGDMKLAGFGLPVWTLLLYWRDPRLYVPYNVKTKHFLKSFGLARLVPSTASPATYMKWHALAQDLQRVMKLASIGHVDLVAWEHWKDTHPE